MANEVDIIENDLLGDFGQEVFDILLTDQSMTVYRNDGTTHHIFWATNDYEELGEGYAYNDEIMRERITGEYSGIIKPRVLKKKEARQKRVKKMAEIFTPSWVCCYMNDNADASWFGHNNVFAEVLHKERAWKTHQEKIEFPEGKTWEDYVRWTWMEITCGEAPFMVSRYDTTTGVAIPVKDRIGFLDHKLRVINENVDDLDEWLEDTVIAYEAVRGYEWQGDSLFLARENLLYTFIDNYEYKFGGCPPLKAIKEVAETISWNVFQMDGLKGVIPNTCHDVVTTDLFGEEKRTPCPGCKSMNIHHHNGIPVLLKNFLTGETAQFHTLSNQEY